ncbi:uncharacterized protein LOC121392836 isoform X3 [Gigantopelta aegis]|uniref:uncharacterized protein LOC121392836 isoform X3 n=1 Tax=Gigantopelta aegis TaxID=1735272 RepID=UPI001B88794E|nr:uncharacterized protein LOC121392836 isoform X3 [Gigantopelta aegis]
MDIGVSLARGVEIVKGLPVINRLDVVHHVQMAFGVSPALANVVTVKVLNVTKVLEHVRATLDGLRQNVQSVQMDIGVSLARNVEIVKGLHVIKRLEVASVRQDGLDRHVQSVQMDIGVSLARNVEIVKGLHVIKRLEVASVRQDGLDRHVQTVQMDIGVSLARGVEIVKGLPVINRLDVVHHVQMAFGVSLALANVVTVKDLNVTKVLEDARASLDGLRQNVQTVQMDIGVSLARDVDIVKGLPVINRMDIVHHVQMTFGVSLALANVVTVKDLNVTKLLEVARASLDGLRQNVQTVQMDIGVSLARDVEIVKGLPVINRLDVVHHVQMAFGVSLVLANVVTVKDLNVTKVLEDARACLDGLLQNVQSVQMDIGVTLARNVEIVKGLHVIKRLEVANVRQDGLDRHVQTVQMDIGVSLARDVDIVKGLPVINRMDIVHHVQMAFGVSPALANVVTVQDLNVTKVLEVARASLDGLRQNVQHLFQLRQLRRQVCLY